MYITKYTCASPETKKEMLEEICCNYCRNHFFAEREEANVLTGHIRMAKSYDFMTINRMSIGKMALGFLHYFNFNTNLLIFGNQKISHIVASETSLLGN